MPDPNKMSDKEIRDYKAEVNALMVGVEPDAHAAVMGAVQQAQAAPVGEVGNAL